MSRVETIRIVLTFADGTLGFMSFVTRQFDKSGEIIWENPPTQFAIDKVIAQLEGRNESDPLKIALPLEKRPVQRWRIMKEEDIPPKDEFRNALRDDGIKIVIDMEHARSIKLDALRSERADKLTSLDESWFKAAEMKDDVALGSIAAAKQKLRDMPQLVDASLKAAATTEDLRAIKLPE